MLGKAMQWDRRRAEDRAKKAPDPPHVPYPKRQNKTPFPQVYARYANAERAQGRKPLPPLQWIAALKARSQGRRQHP